MRPVSVRVFSYQCCILGVICQAKRLIQGKLACISLGIPISNIYPMQHDSVIGLIKLPLLKAYVGPQLASVSAVMDE